MKQPALQVPRLQYPELQTAPSSTFDQLEGDANLQTWQGLTGFGAPFA